ncbi:NAD(P)-dependent oxidoreductase [Actinopolymorpha singaporensis]|uniref:3-hydroxyisobutyrate dehydrogenase n=1 Tax=Actinopolymorpha singaporensis TaxID=117157 RepID=A0A1H1WFX2_9ACTN|nr:NAD(P)-dependent oxidoreductase [Actinopolymorpha singaporensis]SDS95955.1 3-hydroxyisobutyrate dehydrogenase [Actinopolymorpha singaporensis]
MAALPKSARIGFVGLGNLGLPMATALVRAGWSVTAYDVNPGPVATMVERGADGADSLGDLAGCRVLALAVPDDDTVTAVLDTPELLDQLADDAVVAVHSTVLPATARELGDRARERSLAFLDAPVSGGAERAERGTLTVMVGADEAALEPARPYLDTIAEQVVHAGPPGAGAAAKLANQLMMFASLAGTHEALRLAQAHGVSVETVLEVARTSTGDSWSAREWGFFDRTAQAYDASQVPVRSRPWSKDLWEVVAAGRVAGVTMPVAGLLAQTLADVVEEHARSVRSGGEPAD